jgi:hypothetical protein
MQHRSVSTTQVVAYGQAQIQRTSIVSRTQRCNKSPIKKRKKKSRHSAYIFVSEVLEQLQLTVRPLSEYGRAEGLHDLLDGDILVGELVSRRAVWRGRGSAAN